MDDNRDSADSLATDAQHSWATKSAPPTTGLEAVDLAATFNPEVVLMDIGLPMLNGFDAARRMREQPGGNDMVLVALTGWGQEEDRRRSQEAGFDHHMSSRSIPSSWRSCWMGWRRRPPYPLEHRSSAAN